ncbi:MAG TPA: ribose 5-phosphate isomerase B [Acidimicrobiales bacterium]|nr:ribose 5-phosphate isomerase B [Acidimicrobiales bacterium]
MRVSVGSDHAGLELKGLLAEHLASLGHEVVDLGTSSPDSVDYPDYGAAVGRSVASGETDLGVCVCGTGIGISIAANKVHGVRAAVVHDVSSARLAREHNDANVVCLGARLVGPVVATDALEMFLRSEFAGGRHLRRIEKIAALEGDRAMAPLESTQT